LLSISFIFCKDLSCKSFESTISTEDTNLHQAVLAFKYNISSGDLGTPLAYPDP